MRLSLRSAIAVGLGFLPLLQGEHCLGQTRKIDFNRDVKPILSETCYQCHGPDANKRKADMRLDTREGLFRDFGAYRATVPGKPEDSEIVARITSEDPEERMPPPDSGKKLSPAQVDLIRSWIAQGAEWKGHWAYLKPERSTAPDFADHGFARNDIDRFVFAKMRERGLIPSPEADRVTLIRRLGFDLTGLPPSPEEVEAFLLDNRADAYERLVDKLLDSPHYGERMASFWLDLVRYADTTGYHGDNHRDVRLFRDYVINSFNQNKPFNQFTIEQLAGDLLPGSTAEQKIASGYNCLLQTTQEGGAQAKEYLAKYSADRVRNVSTVWLGSTLGCAECHDHKYDPFATRDFYRLAAYFADIKEVAVGAQEQTPIPSPEQEAELARLEREIAPLQAALDVPRPELAAKQAQWEKRAAAERPQWKSPKPDSAESANGATLKQLDDRSIMVSGKLPDDDTYTVKIPLESAGLTAVRLEVISDKSLPKQGPGRGKEGGFLLSEFEAKLGARPVQFRSASASRAFESSPADHAIDGKESSGWSLYPQSGKTEEAVFEVDPAVVVAGEKALTIVMKQTYGSNAVIGKFRISLTNSPRPILARGKDGLPRIVAEALETDPAKRTEDQKQTLAARFREITPELKSLQDKLTALKSRRDGIKARIPQTIIAKAVEPRAMRILPRGNWLDDTGPIVSPGAPPSLGGDSATPADGKRATRRELADWVVSNDNPLAARVFVNRVWKLLFGQGIVSTLDDFGSQGARPSHPELLDRLAVEFRDGGWNVKQLVKSIATSATYRQSSISHEDHRQVDPANTWLARQGRYRLDAEFVRDNALAVSGLLSRRVGGETAKPYQPAGYWFHLNFPKREYQPDHGEGLYRRGLYTYWCRSFLHPSLLAFDAPTREECQVDRPRSNTPLQALVLLNDPTYVESSRVFAERVLSETDKNASDDDRLRRAYRLALSREPRGAEFKVLKTVLDKQRKRYAENKAAAEELLKVGEKPASRVASPTELAAWTAVCRVILNLHETITRN